MSPELQYLFVELNGQKYYYQCSSPTMNPLDCFSEMRQNASALLPGMPQYLNVGPCSGSVVRVLEAFCVRDGIETTPAPTTGATTAATTAPTTQPTTSGSGTTAAPTTQPTTQPPAPWRSFIHWDSTSKALDVYALVSGGDFRVRLRPRDARSWYDPLPFPTMKVETTTRFSPIILNRRQLFINAAGGGRDVTSGPWNVLIEQVSTGTTISYDFTLGSGFPDDRELTGGTVTVGGGTTLATTAATTGGGGGGPVNTGNYRMVYSRLLSMSDPTDAAKVSEHIGFVENMAISGINGLQIGVMADHWYSNSYTKFDNLMNKALQRNLRPGMHIWMNLDSNNRAARYSWLTDDMCQRYNDGSFHDNQRFPSLEYLRAWEAGSGYDASNPFYRLEYDHVRPVLNRYGGSLMEVSTGISVTGEVNYSTHTGPSGIDKIMGYEDRAQNGFRQWALSKFGGTLSGINNAWGTAYNQLSDIVLPFNSGEIFNSYGGDGGSGTGMSYKKAAFLYRSEMLRLYQRWFESIVRSYRSNLAVFGEAGTAANAQAALYGTLNFRTLTSTSDIVKENFYTGYNWRQGADRLRSLHTTPKPWDAELDGSLLNSQTLQWSPEWVTTSHMLDQIKAAFNRGMRGLSLFQFTTTEATIRAVVENLAASGYIGTPIPTIVPSATTSYSTRMIRNLEPILTDYNSLGGETNPIRLQIIEESL